MSFQAKDPVVRDRQLKVQTLRIPLAITGNATPASVVVRSDEPAVLFLKTQGVDQISGVVDGSPSFAAANDANGVFNAMLKINEPLAKVVCAKLVSRSGTECIACSMANTSGLSAAGDKILLNVDSSVDLSAANLDACLEVSYVVAE